MGQKNRDAESSAELLAEATGRPVSDFEPREDTPYPDLDDLEEVDPDEVNPED